MAGWLLQLFCYETGGSKAGWGLHSDDMRKQSAGILFWAGQRETARHLMQRDQS